MAEFIKQCHVDKKDLVDVMDANDTCRKRLGTELQFWQTPEGAITLGVLVFVLGGFAGSQL